MSVASSPLSFIISATSTMPVYNCSDCSYRTSSLRKLGRHKSVNHAGVKYRCEHCDFITGYQSNYYRHRKQVHSNALNGHHTKLHPNVAMIRQQEKSKLTSSAAINKSLISDKNISRFAPYPNVSSFVLNNSSTATIANGVNRVVSERHNNHPVKNISNIVDHDHTDEEWICSECGAEFRSKIRLDVHFNSCHVNTNSPPQPPTDSNDSFNKSTTDATCESLFTDYRNKATLENGHSKMSPPSQVSKSDAKVLTPENRNNDSAGSLSNNILSIDQEQALLSQASLAYLTKSFVKNVRNNSTKTEPDITEENEDDNRPLDLSKAELAANGSADNSLLSSFRCDLCPYTTDDSVRFRKHLRCHQTTAATKCQFCNFTTVYSWNLDRHVRCHRRTSLYTCRRCSFSQNTRQSMSFHLQHHHVIVTCDQCVQTDGDGRSSLDVDAVDDIPFETDVVGEPYIFEKHAVIRNEATDVMDSDDSCSSPKSYLSTSSSSKHVLVINDKVGLDDDQFATACGESNEENVSLKSRNSTEFNGVECSSSSSNRRLTKSRPTNKKYLSERDAIELPSDKFTFEETNDPDIKNRFCSICGYQGKWISEMIRHKRVHTNERPFKCKYCDRTSKWKADLIRHVNKVHGIRVVSKYSRSNTFDADANVVKALKEAHRNESIDCVSDGSIISDMVSEHGSIAEGTDMSEYANQNNQRQQHEYDSNLHKSSPDYDEEEMIMMNEENDEDLEKMELQQQEQNLLLYQQQQRQFSDFANQLLLAHFASMANNGNNSALPVIASGDSPLQDPAGGIKQLPGALEKYVTIYQSQEGEPVLKCRICPYETRDLHTFRAHTQKHENKKPYQCSACGYRSNWSSDVHKHIRLKKTGHQRAFVVKLNDQDCNIAGVPYFMNDIPVALLEGDDNVFKNESVKLNSGSPLVWKCAKCDFDDDNRSAVIDHLNVAHNVLPYACRVCKFTSLHRNLCIDHIQSQHVDDDSKSSLTNAIIENLIFEYRHGDRNGGGGGGGGSSSVDNGKYAAYQASIATAVHGPPPNVVIGKGEIIQPLKRSLNDQSSAAAAAVIPAKIFKPTFNTTASECSSAPSNGCDSYSPVAATKIVKTSSPPITDGQQTCDQCPFTSTTFAEMSTHRKAHQRPVAGLMWFKCVFCDWYAKKKPLIVEHLKLHTDDPAAFMAEVERNLITPLSNKAACEDDNASNVLKSFQRKSDAAVNGCYSNDETCKTSTPLDLTKPLTVGRHRTGNGFDIMSDFNVFLAAAAAAAANEEEEIDLKNHHENFIRRFQNLTNGHSNNFPIGMPSSYGGSPAVNQHATVKAIESNRSLDRKQLEVEPSESTSDREDTVDPEAYIHAGEEGLGDEQLFAEMVPNDIQKVNAMVDGQIRKMWQCRYCSHVSKRRANIRMHEKKHFKPNAVGLLKCPKCSYRGDKRSLKIHYRTHLTSSDYSSHSQRFSCSYCPATFRKREVLNVHTSFHGGHNRYRCTQCSYAVPSQHQLTQHVQVHKSNSNRSSTSAAAAAASLPKSNNWQQAKSPATTNGGVSVKSLPLPPTLNDKSSQKIYCRYCPAKFLDASQLRRHEQFHNNNNAGLKYRCHLCDYSVPFPINLSKHLKVHHGLSTNINTSTSTIATGGNNLLEAEFEETIAAQLECEAYDQYLNKQQQQQIAQDDPPSSVLNGNGLKMKINLGKLTAQQ